MAALADAPRPKLTLVDRALEADGITAGDATRKVLNAHAGSIAKQVRKEVTNELLHRLGVQKLEDASQVAQLTTERDARPTPQEEAKHGRFRFYQGAVLGMVIGSSLMLAAGALTLGEVFRQAGTYGREMAVTGAIAQGVNTPEPCIPGQALPDGRVCPVTNSN